MNLGPGQLVATPKIKKKWRGERRAEAKEKRGTEIEP